MHNATSSSISPLCVHLFTVCSECSFSASFHVISALLESPSGGHSLAKRSFVRDNSPFVVACAKWTIRGILMFQIQNLSRSLLSLIANARYEEQRIDRRVCDTLSVEESETLTGYLESKRALRGRRVGPILFLQEQWRDNS